MGLQLITAPAANPVSLTEALDHLRIDDENDNDTVNTLIPAAVEFIERATRQQLCPATYALTLDTFPTGEIRLPKPPLQAVTGITYTTATGSAATVDPSTYTVDASQRPGRVVLKPGHSWPATDNSAANIRVTFTAGYATVPFLLRQAIKFLIAHYFENREAATDKTTTEVPLAVQSIVDMHAFPEAV